MLIEMHCHTAEHSQCSRVSAADIAQHNFDIGLECTVFTDHHYLWPPEEIEALRRKLKIPDYYLILSGQEVTTSEMGDVLVYGADVSIKDGTPLRRIRELYPNAAIIWAHPYRKQKVPSREKLFDPMIDGIEIFNSNHTVTESNRGLQDWHELKFTAIAGTDTHALSYAGLYPTSFDHPVSNIIELAGEIKAGRCRPYFTEIPRAGTSSTAVTEISTGTGTSGDIRESYVIKKHRNISSWHSAERTAHTMEEIRRHGFSEGKFLVPKPLGTDHESMTSVEQAIKGKTLYDQLIQAGQKDALVCIEMAAEWLARLHNCKLRILPAELFFSDELLRLERYVSAFYRIEHRHTRKAQEIMDRVLELENSFYCHSQEKMVLGHGDFHPKNIYIGQSGADPSSRFVAAIDFNSSHTMPTAFDVGTFLSQFRNQFYNEKKVLRKVSEKDFLDKYLKTAMAVDSDFLRQVTLFKARTSLSICYYLIKVGLGESENLWRVLVEAEHHLANISV